MDPIHGITKKALPLALKLVIWNIKKTLGPLRKYSIVGQIAQAFGNILWIPKSFKPLVMRNIFKNLSFFCHLAM
jgi:hypothetical protein